jgi:fermentation-respiration switch protein FrsA (DUF1100 family)
MILLISAPGAIVLAVSLFLFLVLPALSFLLAPRFVMIGLFKGHFMRYPDEPKTRHPSAQESIQLSMYQDGMNFAARTKAKKEEVSIQNDGLVLKGVYLDYGRKDSVIIVPGRLESVNYSYYFAQLYENSSFNVLLIDQRACGESDGVYCTGGVKESADLLVWIRYLHEEKKQEAIVLHGSCIGAASVILALSDPSCPSYVKGAMSEGTYTNLIDMFASHSTSMGHHTKAIYKYLPGLFRKRAGADVVKDSPINRITKVTQPILFLQSRQDAFIPVSVAQRLYDACPSQNKRLEYFDFGGHSRIRYQDPKRYDALVRSWMESLVR